MFPLPLKTDESSTVLGEFLQLSAEMGVDGAILSVGVLFLYVIIRIIAITIINPGSSHLLLSFRSDAVFLITSTVIGLFTVQASGSLLTYHFYTGIKDGSISSVALGFIALGIGAGVLEMTLPETWEVLIRFI